MSPKVAQPSRLAWTASLMTGYIVSSFIGLPLFLAGALFINEKLMNAWHDMAHAFARALLANRGRSSVVQKEPPPTGRPVEFWQQALGDTSVLSVVLHDTGIFGRFLRSNNDGVIQRQDLSPVLADELSSLGLEVSGESALRYTLKQMEAGVIDGVGKLSLKSGPVRSAKEPKVSAEQPPSQPQSPAPSLRTPSQHEDKGRAPNKASGVVKFAGTNEVRPENRKPYKSFTILVECKDGEHSFSGIDLEEKFSKGFFKVGDTVSIEKRSVNFTIDLNGETKTRRKNEFDIQVLRSPQ